jgi:hypothetical protein
MKASPSARSWIAAGVRHELLTRALPALRHDMAAPVSVIRMALLMLKRQVGAATIDAVACEERPSARCAIGNWPPPTTASPAARWWRNAWR